jgi:CheY-like chemotaxis protein
VLVVDDNETNRHVVCEMLDRWGSRPTPAADGWEALEILRAAAEEGAAFEVALVDFQMPEMDGGRLAAEIKKDSHLAGLPLVLLTSVPQQAETARHMGFEACLAKPIKGASLRQAIETALHAPAEGEGEPPPVAPSRRPVPAEGPARILVVDDDTASRKVAVELLGRLGCQSDAVGSGEEALEALDRVPYDLVFMDCQMPEVDGYETTRRIRENDRIREGVVIVAMTGDAFGEDRARCLEAGMNDHVAKPVRGADFERVLARYLPARV